MGMKPASHRVTEHAVAHAACIVLAPRVGREGSMQILKKEIPSHLQLSAADLAGSKTRRHEAMWEQQIRNITSHHKSPSNFIYAGYLRLQHNGLA